jgi:hypothetical protein
VNEERKAEPQYGRSPSAEASRSVAPSFATEAKLGQPRLRWCRAKLGQPPGLSAVDPSNPQSWNRYAYVTNDPLVFADPWGLCVDNGSPCSGGNGGSAPWASSGCSDVSLDGGITICTNFTGTFLDWIGTPVKTSAWVQEFQPPSPSNFNPSQPVIFQGGYMTVTLVSPPAYSWGDITIGSGIPGANNGPTATIGPPSQQYKPAPTGLKKYLTQYVPCAIGEGINQFWGDDDKAAATVLANIAPLAPANLLKGGPWVYLGLTAAYDFSNALAVRQTCTQSVYGGG